MRADIAADDIEQAVLDRVSETPAQDATVELADGRVDLSASVSGPLGELPVLMAIAPVVADGEVRFEPLSVEVDGRRLPPGMVDRIGGPVGAVAGGEGCDGSLGGGPVDVVDAYAGTDGSSVTTRL